MSSMMSTVTVQAQQKSPDFDLLRMQKKMYRQVDLGMIYAPGWTPAINALPS